MGKAKKIEKAEVRATKTVSGRKAGSSEQLFSWPFGKMNYILLAVGLLVIGLGYVFLGIGPYDSVQSMSISPILLTIGYVVLVPYAIIYKGKEKKTE